MILMMYVESTPPEIAEQCMGTWLRANAPHASALGTIQANGYICHAFQESPLDDKPPVSESPAATAAV